MNKQITLSVLTDELGQAKTRKKEFLQQMDRIVPWGEWEGIIKPYYYKGERGNKPYDLKVMMRIYLVQNLYDLSDMATMTEIIDSRAFSEFCGVDSSNQIPDGDTIGRFRALLVEHGIQEKLFKQVVDLLSAQGLILKKGTIVDSTIIAAPSSTKNREGKRDPEACQAKKGTTWHFGYKAHIGVDKETGLVHHVEVTSANVQDVTVTSRLLTGEETEVYGDSGYLGAEKREDAIKRNQQGKRIKYKVNRRRTQVQKHQGRSGAQIKRREHEKSSVRAKVEHVFGVVKGLFWYRKTRYRGLRKQVAKLNIMFALANLYLADKRGLLA
jgi:IS5 family transposase